MKAAFIKNLHEPLVIEEVKKPQAGPGEVVVQLKAASLNHRDVWIQKGLYPKITTPIIPGSDGAGIVSEIGEGVDSAWLDKEVIINPSQNWGDNPAFYGEEHKILGLPDNGTFAEFVKVEARYLVQKPAYLSFEQAATLPLGALTAWRALHTRAKWQPGDKVLVTGAGGGVALFVIQFAIAAGAEVWVTSGSDQKIQKAVEMGAKGGVNYKNPTWFRDLLVKARGPKLGYFDVIIDSAGGAGFAKLTDIAAPGARICFYGGGTGNITDVVPAKVFFKQLNILGTTMGTESEFQEMIKFVEEKQIMPIIDTVFPLDEAEKALRLMDSGQQFGKIVLKI
ncbi:zinc-binding dehydrogenase [Dyadobacter chenwenxiniae]|uniref:Zinc-binding dehydrogenase n=1 Tax=Dyadobacter chenwenxiniae TaxID=2906456 RepID=A0A9X1PR30_9BACT|nr:zinc-binding dehydrogenase [Dyadobacter chenwenxiniae]MCF0051360.1 zinc-binding dehydrogenase [Dyadobacter chenwenxiniae]MCF0065468.1 zinc-binding dehydrogenase [Dyadobacter chenwenxiniae]UON82124.1 zinc-binding dehydrogenase [Dyadobacter chenwenxiniae]